MWTVVSVSGHRLTTQKRNGYGRLRMESPARLDVVQALGERTV